MTTREAAARLYHHARGEALFSLLVWALALVWALGYCYLFGYLHKADSWVVRAGLAKVRTSADLTYSLGMPDWVLYGIVVPWLACSAVTILYCLIGMHDDDLGTEAEEASHVGH